MSAGSLLVLTIYLVLTRKPALLLNYVQVLASSGQILQFKPDSNVKVEAVTDYRRV